MKYSMQKAYYIVINSYGRGERTRTFDLTVPNRARYQLRHTPIGVTWDIIPQFSLFFQSFLPP